MKLKGRPSLPLDDGMRELLLRGPWAVGLDLQTAPDHETLRALWRQHETALLAEAEGRGIVEPWFVSRDWFVRMVEN